MGDESNNGAKSRRVVDYDNADLAIGGLTAVAIVAAVGGITAAILGYDGQGPWAAVGAAITAIGTLARVTRGKGGE